MRSWSIYMLATVVLMGFSSGCKRGPNSAVDEGAGGQQPLAGSVEPRSNAGLGQVRPTQGLAKPGPGPC